VLVVPLAVIETGRFSLSPRASFVALRAGYGVGTGLHRADDIKKYFPIQSSVIVFCSFLAIRRRLRFWKFACHLSSLGL
jgi:hypothetical protein